MGIRYLIADIVRASTRAPNAMVISRPPQPYPPIEPHRSGMLQVDAVHSLYWEESGNPHGIPVVLLHGGPGSGTVPRHRQFFDPAYYRIVLFDQRGAGRSTPPAECRDNTTPLLVADMETLRTHLGIESWIVFGGSWGSTLTLAYAQANPPSCRALVLRGVFLCTQDEIDWFLHGMGRFFPIAHQQFVAPLEAHERDDLLAAYMRSLFGDDAQKQLLAARAWNRYESSCVSLWPQPEEPNDAKGDATALAVARLEAHYFHHRGFFEPDQLLRHVDRLHHIPALIVQGRYDVVCPPMTAIRLQQAWPRAQLQIVEDAGHSAFEPGIEAALLVAMNRYRDHGNFDPACAT